MILLISRPEHGYVLFLYLGPYVYITVPDNFLDTEVTLLLNLFLDCFVVFRRFSSNRPNDVTHLLLLLLLLVLYTEVS